MIPFNGAAPVDGFGPLTLGDLELRADGAFAEHMATYTATEILHRAYMALPDRDPATRALVDAASNFIRVYRERTRDMWHGSQRDWENAAGMDLSTYPPEETPDTPADEDEG